MLLFSSHRAAIVAKNARGIRQQPLKSANCSGRRWMADPKVRRKSLCCNQLQVAVPGLCAFLEAA
jgi:hypothetical protein